MKSKNETTNLAFTMITSSCHEFKLIMCFIFLEYLNKKKNLDI